MTTVHVFAGSPKIKNSINNAGQFSSCDAPHFVWKTYTYFQSQLLHDCQQIFDGDLSEVNLEYKLDRSQLSDLRPSNSNSAKDMLDVVSVWSCAEDHTKTSSVPLNQHITCLHFDENDSRGKLVAEGHKNMGNTDLSACEYLSTDKAFTANEGAVINHPSYSNIKTIAEAVQLKCSFDFLGVVLQINTGKTVQIKKGYNARGLVNLSSILVGDHTYSYFRVTLWNRCAKWIDSYSTGDIILLTNLSIRMFRNQPVGQSSVHSQTYNFKRASQPYPLAWSGVVDIEKLQATAEWARKDHYYLYVENATHRYSSGIVDTFCNLSAEHTNNLLAKVVCCVGNSFSFKSKSLMKLIQASIELQDKHNESLALHLCSEHAGWITKFQNSINQFVQLTYVVYKCDPHTERYILHTTPKSTFQFIVDSHVTSSILKFRCDVRSVCFKDDSSLVFVVYDAVKFEDLEHLIYIGCSCCFSVLSESSCGGYESCAVCGNGDFHICVQTFNLIVRKCNDNFEECNVLVNPRIAAKIFPSLGSVNFRMLNDHPEKIIDIISKTFHSMFTSYHEISLKEINGNKFEEFSLVKEKSFLLMDIVSVSKVRSDMNIK